jgi:predicted thioesterase
MKEVTTMSKFLYVVYDNREADVVVICKDMDSAIKNAIQYAHNANYEVTDFAYGEGYTTIEYKVFVQHLYTESTTEAGTIVITEAELET